MSNKYFAFTIKAKGGRISEIITDVSVSQSKQFKPLDDDINTENVKALWDTGASKSCISTRLAQKLCLPVVGMEMMQTASGKQIVPRYIVDIKLPHGVDYLGIPVAAFVGSAKFDILIGMDLITLGDLAITNARGETCVSYRMPFDVFHIDYVACAQNDKKGKNQKKQLRRKQRR